MIPIQIVTVFTPRPQHPKWYDYLALLRIQRDSARWFGHGHLVVTDSHLPDEFNQLRTYLPPELMQAMIAGVVAKLKHARYEVGGGAHLVFADCDCLVARNLDEAFDSDIPFDLGLTHRVNDLSPINNGAMYVPQSGIAAALAFFEHALSICGTHWGADQEAISQAAAPVLDEDGYALRHGCRVSFLNMKRYAAVPKTHLSKHGEGTFIVHFKGNTKEWMADYARSFVFKEDGRGSR